MKAETPLIIHVSAQYNKESFYYYYFLIQDKEQQDVNFNKFPLSTNVPYSPSSPWRDKLLHPLLCSLNHYLSHVYNEASIAPCALLVPRRLHISFPIHVQKQFHL